MSDNDRHKIMNTEFPVLCFRSDHELKRIIIRYGIRQGFINEKTGKVNIHETLHYIVEEHLKSQGILKLKYESTI